MCEYTSIDENEEGFDASEKTVIYKSSGFFNFYEEMLNRVKNDDDGRATIDNRFFNIKYAEDFLIKNISLLPLWSGFFSSHRESEYKRFNNGDIEGYFGRLKQTCEKNTKLSKLGTIKIGRYVNEIKKNVMENIRRIEFNLPDHDLSRAKYGENSSNRSLAAETENWRGKSKAGLFSSTATIVKGGGS